MTGTTWQILTIAAGLALVGLAGWMITNLI